MPPILESAQSCLFEQTSEPAARRKPRPALFLPVALPTLDQPPVQLGSANSARQGRGLYVMPQVTAGGRARLSSARRHTLQIGARRAEGRRALPPRTEGLRLY